MNQLAVCTFAASSLIALASRPARAADLVASPVIVIDTCRGARSWTDAYKPSDLEQSIGGFEFSGGVAAKLSAVADCDKIGASATANAHAAIFDGLFSGSPLDVSLDAATARGGMNTLNFTAKAFGHDLYVKHLAQTTALSGGFSTPSFALPDGNNWDGTKTILGATVTYDTFASMGATVLYTVNPSEVTVRLLPAGTMNAPLTATEGPLRGTGHLDIARLTQGGHATLKRGSGSAWTTDLANTLTFNHVAGGKLDVSAAGHTENVFNVAPKSYAHDYAFTETFLPLF